MSVLRLAPSQYGSGCSVAKPRRYGSITSMNKPSSVRKVVITATSIALLPALIYFILISHEAWGDSRYVLKEEAVREQIARLDTDIGIADVEILHAVDENEKAKFLAIKAIFVREKEALRDKLKKLN